MSKTMLIDASHEEETRVVIVNDGRVEDLDFESAAKRQIRGNVYLARVTRVEPSLQAAFIEYGGNRHGFLAFPEIHPDYYQIPHEDRVALQKQEEEELAAEDDDEDELEEDENLDPDEDDTADETDAEVADEQVKVASTRRKRINRRRYKIQEVIKRGQVLLVQAVKEERGNKGAAMTTYLSLAGRYSVLMPNTPRGGGISRKISSATDRKRLKKIMDGLEVPQGMGVIVRTAGAKRTKADIKRDYDYLTKLWDDIRDTTMESTAPALIHEEGNLVKRALRDLYNKDIGKVLIEGGDAYKTAKSFIKMLMPSHAKNVKEHKGDMPLFLEYGVEAQIEKSLDATVQLKSGGYLVIHPTEALVSVDVNSGRSTKERNVERTALKTNLEAADEVARQMRLRDLAGLIVIDFIDMDESKNNRAVEKRMKEALASDRARVQWGKISQFGLMEISRQRRRRSLLDASTTVCRHCDGVGRKRTVESSALKAIRQIEEVAARGKADRVRVKVASDVAHYIVNEKRDELVAIEKAFGTFTEVVGDDEMIRPDYEVEVLDKRKGGKDLIAEAEKERRKTEKAERAAAAKAKKAETAEDEDDDADDEAEEAVVRDDDGDDKPRRRRRGRRGGRGRRRREDADESRDEAEVADAGDADEASDGEAPKGRRRRKAPSKSGAKTAAKGEARSDADEAAQADEPVSEPDTDGDKPKSGTRRRAPGRRKAPAKSKTSAKGESSAKSKASDAEDTALDDSPDEAVDDAPKARGHRKAPAKKAPGKDGDTAAKPKRARKAPSKAKAPAKAKASEEADADEDAAKAKAPGRRRKAPAKATADKASTKAPDVDAAIEQEGMPEAEDAPKRRRRAPAKTSKAKSSTTKSAAKKSPAKSDAAKSDDVEAAEAGSGTKRTRKAPAKSAKAKTPATKAAAKTADTEAAADAKPKTTRKRVAPSKTPAAKAKAPAKAATDTATATRTATRKAPARKAAAKTSASKSSTSKTAAKKATAEKPEDSGSKKRGWWNRVIGS